MVVSPKSAGFHQRVVGNLRQALNEQLPSQWEAVTEYELVVMEKFPPTTRIPDIVVTESALIEHNAPRVRGNQVILVAEVLSDGTRSTDQVTKLVEYAKAGIPNYWIVDPAGPISVVKYRLENDAYVFEEESTDMLVMHNPARLEIDIQALGKRA